MTGAGTDHTKPSLSGGPAIILVRPQLAVNIGMCARAMANFGLSDRLVSRREGSLLLAYYATYLVLLVGLTLAGGR